MSEQHDSSTVECGASHLAHEGGLAETRLSRDQEDFPSLALRNAFGCVGHRLHFRLTAHHSHTGADSQAARERDGCPGVDFSQGLPDDLDGLDGIGQTFQFQLTEGTALVTASASSHGPDHVGGQDLSALAHWAHRRAASTTGSPKKSSSSRLTSPPLSPTRSPTVCSLPRLSRSTPCCMATPQSKAADADGKTAIIPSPRFLTSAPPVSVMAWRRIEKCVLRDLRPPPKARGSATARWSRQCQ